MGWQRWDVMWQEALYGPAGFYRRAAPADHFATSAQGLGRAGDLLAEAVAQLAERHGVGRVVEVAAGRGELLTALHQQSAALELVGVEVADRPGHLPDDIGWLRAAGGSELPEELSGLTGTLLIAHEWLDVVPAPVATRAAPDRAWRHLEVDLTGTERNGPPVEGCDLAWLTAHVPDRVERAEVGRTRDLAYADLTSRVQDGVVLVIDYGHTRSTRPTAGTLTGYQLGTQVTPVPDGTCDLTAHVSVDTLGADRLCSQREALQDLLGRPTLPPHELAGTRPAAYLEQLARASALATLTRPGGLGDFWWVTTRCGPAASASVESVPDRSSA